ncbi:MAG: trimethylamine methyltransferase family protein [Paracoccaceae bacterium]
MHLARRNHGLMVTSFTVAGIMAPVTMMVAVAQPIAEILCAVFSSSAAFLWPANVSFGRLFRKCLG